MSEYVLPDKIFSTLADDEDLREIVMMFVQEMPDRIAKIEAEFVDNNWSELERTAHQLKGAAGSYGFEKIGPIASKLETLLKSHAQLDEIAAVKDHLIALCQRITAEPMNV